ncbi:MAG TPA: MFS transporter [Steroidobacteraceae bacterium]|nr:MFS transporter [Steroidobacteraceae bacterium]
MSRRAEEGRTATAAAAVLWLRHCLHGPRQCGLCRSEDEPDLHFSATVYGLGGGLFFLSYALCEIPSNLLLVRIGARRWIAQIMIAWGAVAAGMMFVRTPAEFYCMRFLLGIAEGGFFPGVIFYLTQWFPREHRGRVVSRFFFAGPVSAAIMGAVSGQLLALQGTLGLAGWQWLFLVQGLPAVVLGIVVLMLLPDRPADARWLSADERAAVDRRLTEGGEASSNVQTDVRTVIASPLVRRLAACAALIYASNYSLVLSAPLLLQGVTRWSATRVGLIMSGSYLLAAVAMLLNGQHSDRWRERYLHVLAPMLIFVLACLGMALGKIPALVVGCYAASVVTSWSLQAVFWLIPGDATHGRFAAIGIAAIGCIGMLGAFVGPYAWGLAKDATGSYQTGLIGLAALYGIAAAILLTVRRGQHARAGRALRAEPSLPHLGSCGHPVLRALHRAGP